MTVIIDGVKVIGAGQLGTTIEIAEIEALAKGTIIVGDGSGAPSLLAVGPVNQILQCDPSQPEGVRWTADPRVDSLGIGTAFPNATLEVMGNPGASVGGFPSGALHVTSPSASANANAVITGHNLSGGNKQLWYLGSVSGSNDNIALINRQFGSLSLQTGGAVRLTVENGGTVVVEQRIKIKGGTPGFNQVLTSDLFGLGSWETPAAAVRAIFAQLSSGVDQIPGDTNPTVVTYNTQGRIAGLTHSTSVNAGEVTIDTSGVYFVSHQPQVGKDSGATKTDFDMFWQIDRGGGFTDEPNSNSKLTIKDSDITDVIVSAFTVGLNAGDKIRMMQRVSSSTVGLGLKATPVEVGPPTVPRTPSIILTIHRVGNL